MFIFEIRFNLQTAPLCRACHARLNLLHKEKNINTPEVAKLTCGHNTKRTPEKGEKRKGKHFQESAQEGNWSLDLRGRKLRLLGGNSCNFHYKIWFQRSNYFHNKQFSFHHWTRKGNFETSSFLVACVSRAVALECVSSHWRHCTVWKEILINIQAHSKTMYKTRVLLTNATQRAERQTYSMLQKDQLTFSPVGGHIYNSHHGRRQNSECVLVPFCTFPVWNRLPW